MKGEKTMWLRVWDKTKEKDGKNTAIYELHTCIENNFSNMRFLKGVVERILDKLESERFIVLLQDDNGNPLKKQ